MLKKKTFGYVERNEQMRKEFQETISKIDKRDVVYMDETGIDDDETYEYGWSPKGPRLYGMKKGGKSKRVSIIGALNQQTLIAPFMFEGSCDRSVFEIYVEKVLIPTLTPGKTIVLDNAAFHHGGNIKKLIESAQCTLLYLPPYSPDFNPIEHFWAPIKNQIRKLLHECANDIYAAAIRALGGVCA
jgi:transposase